MVKVKKVYNILTAILVLGLMCITVYSARKMILQKTVIKDGVMTYYLNSDNSLKYADKTEDKKVVMYYEYFNETKKRNAANNIHYVIQMNPKDQVKSIIEIDKDTNKKTKIYDYYPKEKYIYGITNNMEKNLEQEYFLDNNEFVTLSKKYDEKTHKVIRYFEYYANAQKGKHSAKVQYMYVINDEGNIEYSLEKEVETQKELKKNFYKENTKYDEKGGTHREAIIKTENLASVSTGDNNLDETETNS